MPFTPTAGPVALLKFGTATAPGTDWKIVVDGKIKDVSNFAAGRAYKATLTDGDFSCTLIWDSADMPHDPAGLNLQPDSDVTVQCYVSVDKFFSVPVKISKVTPSVKGMEDCVVYDVEGKLSGALVWPVVA